MQDKFQARQLKNQLPRLPRIIALLLGGDGRNAAGEIGPGGIRIRLDLGPQGVQRVKADLLAQVFIELQPQRSAVQVPLKVQEAGLHRHVCAVVDRGRTPTLVTAA